MPRCTLSIFKVQTMIERTPMSSQVAQRGCGFAFVGFWILLWSLGTLSADVAYIHDLVRQRAGSSFPTVDGTITESKIVEDRDADGTTYIARIRYAYQVAGRDYTADRVRYWTVSAGRGAAERIVEAHPVGSKVTVYYNPADPSDALLRPGITAGDSFLLLFMLPFHVIMLGSWVFAAKLLRRTDKTPGGLRIVDGPSELRARPAWSSPIVAAVVAVSVASAVLVFVVGFFSGFDQPSAQAMAAAWATVFTVAILAYVVASSGRRDLVLDRVRDLVILPAKVFGGAPAPVERSRFYAVDLVEQASTDSEGQNSMRYIPMLRWHGDDGQPAEAEVFPQSSKQRGEHVAAWLRKVILPRSPHDAPA